ncbi:MAG: 2-phospho-L-lactate transferase [Candidatus Limnocylindria bacterium]
MKVTLLAGGTGGAKLAHGFALLGSRVELSIIANVGDDVEVHGLHVSPDVDAIVYTLAGLAAAERGWGITGDTDTARAMFERLGAETWFALGDADLAMCIERTRRLRDGARLTDVTRQLATALGVEVPVLPATDDPYRTRLLTDDGPLAFQEYFVHRRQQPEVRGVEFDGSASTRPSPDVLEAIAAADLLVLGPSNPLVSIGPILALSGVRAAIAAAPAPVVAVSPIVGGRALKGPADRMLASTGHDATATGVARLYADIADRFVIDDVDAALAQEISALGMTTAVLPTVMGGDDERAALAASILTLLRDA